MGNRHPGRMPQYAHVLTIFALNRPAECRSDCEGENESRGVWEFNASQPPRLTVTGGTRFGMESTGTTRQCYRVFDGRIDALRFQDAPSILRGASLSYTARGTFLAFAARKASAAVQNDAPKRTKSLIRNWPVPPSISTPCPSWIAPGVENKKLVVSRNVMMAPRLPMNEARGEMGRSARSNAIRSSTTPIKLETPCLLTTRYIQDMNGLWATSGCIPSASAGVNFKIPMSNRITTNP